MKSKRYWIPVVALSCLCTLSVGFASWAVVGGSSSGSGDLNGGADGVVLTSLDGLTVSLTHNPGIGTYFFSGESNKRQGKLTYSFTTTSDLPTSLLDANSSEYRFNLDASLRILSSSTALDYFGTSQNVAQSLTWGGASIDFAGNGGSLTFSLPFALPQANVSQTKELSLTLTNTLVLLLRNSNIDIQNVKYELSLQLRGYSS